MRDKVTSLVNDLLKHPDFTDPNFTQEFKKQLTDRPSASSGAGSVRYPKIPVCASSQAPPFSRVSDASEGTIRPPYLMSGALGSSDPTSLIDLNMDDCVKTKPQASKDPESRLKGSTE